MEQTAFISYSRHDSKFACRLTNALLNMKITVWIDQYNLRPGEHWDQAIQEALEEATFFIIILSPEAVESESVLDELSYSLASNKIIIPILYRDTKIPFRIARIQWIDFRYDFDSALAKLLACVIQSQERETLAHQRSLYTIPATASSPALVIFLIDCSQAMEMPLAGRTKIEIVMDALEECVHELVARSTKGRNISSRYKIVIYHYAYDVVDVTNGPKDLAQLAKDGLPAPRTGNFANTARALSKVEQFLLKALPTVKQNPAPMVVHITDGQLVGADPEPVAKRIMQLNNSDGNVLISNIYIADVLVEPIADINSWGGILTSTQLAEEYAIKLFNMSSTLPDRYREEMAEFGFSLMPGARMLFPAVSSELVRLAFAVSGSTASATMG